MAIAAATLLAAILTSASPGKAASYPPDLRFQTLTTPAVRVYFHQGLEPAARECAALADEILAKLKERYHTHVPRVHIVLSDISDEAGGDAQSFPRPLVHLTVAAPNGSDELGVHAGWLRLVLTHELTHVVFFEPARGLARLGRSVLGRPPFVFPNAATTPWMVEGLATYEETEATAFGRGRDRDVRMLLRMAALEDRFPRDDQATRALDTWPGGHVPYLFGEAFLRDLSARFGPETLPRIAQKHAAWPLPYLDEMTAVSVTGAPYATRWRQFMRSTKATFASEAEGLRRRGLSTSTALTRRGVRQTGASVSPDGKWIAYTSGTLTRQREIRLMAADGSGDRHLAYRNGGTRLSWAPSGATLVYDEPELDDIYRWRSDLRLLDVASGRVHRLTHGLRAAEPDVAPDGGSVVYVRRDARGSELALLSVTGESLGDLTQSAAGTLWSGPRVSPRGDAVVAARLTPDGYLDIVLLDLASHALRPLTHDRAKDLEPTWSPGGTYVLFRSDRDGVSNIYALRLADDALLRLTRVLGGAFSPALTPDGTRLIFSEYSSRGYDLHAMDVALAELQPADEFVDPYPISPADPAPSTAAVKPYRPLAELLPRFWIPYFSSSSGLMRLGASTAGADPLGYHRWALTLHRTRETGRIGYDAYYVYDRYRPSFFVESEDVTDPMGDRTLRTRHLRFGASLPLERTARYSHALSLAWRGERQEATGGGAADWRQQLSGVDLSWSLGSAKQYPFNISPVDGNQVRLGLLYEASWLGSDASVVKPNLDARTYLRLSDTQALALRLGAATTLGGRRIDHVYHLGGFPCGDDWDISGARPGLLRGYPDDAFGGRSTVYANAEYRFPLLHPERGLWSVPAFVRHIHGSVFVDAGQAWSGRFSPGRTKTAAGVALGTDTFVGHMLPLTATVGIARGFAAKGETRVYVRLGLAF